MTDAKTVLRAKGRTRAEFEPLSALERALVAACRAGTTAGTATHYPARGTPANVVRASFVRFLALGGDDQTPVHERGVQLEGAWLSDDFWTDGERGTLDLDFATVTRVVVLRRCALGCILLTGASLPQLDLSGSRLSAGMAGSRVTIKGSLILHHARVSGQVCLEAASIGDAVEGVGALFICRGGKAIACDGATIGTQFKLGGGCRVRGEVRLVGVVTGYVDCGATRLMNPGGDALACDTARIRGGIFLNKEPPSPGVRELPGAHVTGCVRLNSATVGFVDLRDSCFEHAGSDCLSFEGTKIDGFLWMSSIFQSWEEQGACFLGGINFRGLRVGADLLMTGGRFGSRLFRSLPFVDAASGPLEPPITFCLDLARIDGTLDMGRLGILNASVSLAGAQAAILCDDLPSCATAQALTLDGFTYGRLMGSTTDARQRVEWLEKQPLLHLLGDFRPQPWQHLATTLQAMGHPNAARDVSIAREEQFSRALDSRWQANKQSRPERGLARLRWIAGQRRFWELRLRHFWGWSVCYGYEPLRLLPRILFVWAVYSLIFWLAVLPSVTGQPYLLAPVRPGDSSECLLRRLAGEQPPPCRKPPPDYGSFVAPLYALDVLLPVINLGYKTEWRPVVSQDGDQLFWGHAIRLAGWIGIIIGWIAGITIVGAVTAFFRRD